MTASSCLLLKVTFIHDGSMGQLILDGLPVLEDRGKASNASWHVSIPLYIGGVPPGRAQKNIQVCVSADIIRLPLRTQQQVDP